MIDDSFAFSIFHTDFHEFLEGGVISMIPILELVEVRLNGGRNTFDRHDTN